MAFRLRRNRRQLPADSGAVGGFLEKSLAHFHERASIRPNRRSATTPDMLPLRFQIVSVAHHSRGAIEAAKTGVLPRQREN
jgi:hypothetical protein